MPHASTLEQGSCLRSAWHKIYSYLQLKFFSTCVHIMVFKLRQACRHKLQVSFTACVCSMLLNCTACISLEGDVVVDCSVLWTSG